METKVLSLITALVCLSVFIQTLELLAVRKNILMIWRLETLKAEWPNSLRFLMSSRFFLGLLGLQAAAAIAVPLLYSNFPAVICILLVTTSLVSLRFRGNFQGGSDAMTFVVLTGLTIASLTTSVAALKFGLWWIAVQLVLSYFVSGLVKVRSKNWRSGSAFLAFVTSTIFEDRPLVQENRRLAQVLSWGVILFEISFPIALLCPGCATTFIALGISFHLANAYFLGLNRFFWAWLAAYPAILAVSQN